MTVDKDFIVCGLLNKNIKVFNRTTFETVAVLDGHDDHVWTVDQDRTTIVSGSWDHTVRTWSKETWQQVHCYRNEHNREVSANGSRMQRTARSEPKLI